MFVFTLALEMLFDLNNWKNYLQKEIVLKRFIIAMVISFVNTILFINNPKG